MLLIGGAPTNAALMPPLPSSPWHATHFSAYTLAPCSAVPLPAGKPVPSGRMLMSHALISASEIGFPSPGGSASAAGAATASASTREEVALSIDMLDLSLVVDRPAREAVVVLAGESEHVGYLRGLAPLGHELSA